MTCQSLVTVFSLYTNMYDNLLRMSVHISIWSPHPNEFLSDRPNEILSNANDKKPTKFVCLFISEYPNSKLTDSLTIEHFND